jgi:hypothetical protein
MGSGPFSKGRRLFAALRATVVVPAFLLAALVLVASGCGAEETVYDPRPQPPTRVSVAVNEDEVIVRPPRIAFGPELTQQLPQNRHVLQRQVRSNAPLDVVLVAANLTDLDSHLELRGNGAEATSEALVANGNISLLTALPTGTYRVIAAGIPSAKPGRLVVGPFRSTSENDLLLP